MKALFLRFFWMLVTIIIAVMLVPGVTLSEKRNRFITLVILLVILSVVNMLIKQVLTAISCGCNVLSLGLFFLVINTVLIMLLGSLGIGLEVAGFWPAFWAGLVIAVGAFISNMLFSDAFV